jgi:uncharacterized protein (TIGR02996 family)
VVDAALSFEQAMNAHDDFLRAISAAPNDSAVRLVYADWLDERGESARAEYVRIKCEANALAPKDARRQELQARLYELWAVTGEDWWRALDRAWIKGVCAVVAALADAVAEAKRPLHHRHVLMVHVLRSAPVYSDAGRLDAWEGAYGDAAGDEESSVVDQLLDRIFSLGRHNLYAAFDEQGTWECYQELVREFAREGIATPASPDLSVW